MKDSLIFIDSYINNLERKEICENLIHQLREVFVDYKLGLINKYPDSWGLDKLVDYYFYYGDGFMVGDVPSHLIESGKYEIGCVYHSTYIGECYNWVPNVGVTDHVANIYNSFVLVANLSKDLGFKKVFKVEYDTDFNLDELKEIKKDFNLSNDYILLGARYEHKQKLENWITDVHVLGYNVELFDGFSIVKNDDEYWELCEKIGYYGKWIEYIIPHIIKFQSNHKIVSGMVKEGECRKNYPKTKFDVVNSPSYWTEKWKDMPKVARIQKGDKKFKDKCALYYWNSFKEDLEINCIVEKDNLVIYEKNIILKQNEWLCDEISLDKEIIVKTTNKHLGKVRIKERTINKDNILNSNIHLNLKING